MYRNKIDNVLLFTKRIFACYDFLSVLVFWFILFMVGVIFNVVIFSTLFIVLLAAPVYIYFKKYRKCNNHANDSVEELTMQMIQPMKCKMHQTNINIEIDGINIPIYAKSIVFDNPKASSTFVIVHGAASSSVVFLRFGELLSKQFNVHILEMPTHGQTKLSDSEHVKNILLSKKTTSPNEQQIRIINFFTKFINAYFENNHIKSAHVYGHSFGGFLSIHFAKQYPTKVKHLFCCSSGGVLPTLGENGYMVGFIFKYAITNIHQWYGKLYEYIFCACYDICYESSLDYVYQYKLLNHRDNFASTLVSTFIDFSFESSRWNYIALGTLKQLKCNTTLLYGKLDWLVPNHQGIFLSKYLNIPTYVIPDEYHNPANGSDFAINQINAIVKNVLLNENNDFLLNTVEKISYRPSSRTRFKENKEDICDFIYSTPSSYTTMKRIDYLYKHLLGEKED